MTTARTARPAAKPAARPATPKAEAAKPAEPTAGERLAADLRVLADLAASTPPVVDDLAAALSEVTVVLRVNGPAVDVLAAALAEREAKEQPTGTELSELFFSTRSFLLPNRSITVSAASLDVSVDDIKAAGK